MTISNNLTMNQHEVWFAWRGYLVLRPRRTPASIVARHPHWLYLGRRDELIPVQITQQIIPAGGLSTRLVDHGMLR